MAKGMVTTRIGTNEKTRKATPLSIEVVHTVLEFIEHNPHNAQKVLDFLGRNISKITNKPCEGRR